MIVISDTTPIISLLKINHLELLNQLFGEVQIPDAVYDELTCNDKFKQEAEIICKEKYIKRTSVGNSKSVSLLRKVTGLDLGESEAIILSDEIKADLLLMDEMKGRLVAKQIGLNITGTIGILRIAFEEELLSEDEIKECIEILRQSGRHISDKLYKQLIGKIEAGGDRNGI